MPDTALEPPRYMELTTSVPVHPDAHMTVPSVGDRALGWVLTYGEVDRHVQICAASCLNSYMYLIMSCNRDEAWRRIKLMREAIRNAPDT